MQRQGASYKNAGASLLIGAADLLNGKEKYEPKVGSALWRMQQGAKADMGQANKLLEDSKTGRGKAGQLVMDLTSGAVDLASDAVMNFAVPGAGLTAMGVRSYGSGAMEAQDNGLTRGQQVLSGLKSAAIEVLTEKIGGPFESVYGKTALGGMTKSLAQRLGKSAGMVYALDLLGKASSEAGEEILSDVLNPLADKLLKLDSGEGWKNLWTADGLSQMAYDGLVGGILGLLGGAAEGLNPAQRAQYASDAMDNAMAASRNGKSIATELEADKDGLAAKAITNQASQAAAEANPTVDQQTTPEAAEVPEKAPSGEFNAKTEAKTDSTPESLGEVAPQTAPEESPVEAKKRRKSIGKKTARDIAFDAWFADNVKNAEQKGVAVDASDFADEAAKPSTKAPESAKIESKPKQTNEERVAKSREAALAQNGIDYGYDPRSELEVDSDTGTYREFEPHDMSSEDWEQYKKDLAQARLLDKVDSWLAKNADSYLDAEYGTLDEKHERLQKALNNYVRNQIDQRQVSPEAGEASREVAEAKAQDTRLKGKKRTQTYRQNGFTVTSIGDRLYNVTGPGGRTSRQVANGIDEAIHKHNAEGSEFAKKSAEQQKAKDAELKQMRKDVEASQENPAQVEGSDGKTYEVTKELTDTGKNYQYVVTELDEDGLPTDNEARVFRSRADTNEDAVQYAVEHPELFKVEDYSDLTEGSNDDSSRTLDGVLRESSERRGEGLGEQKKLYRRYGRDGDVRTEREDSTRPSSNSESTEEIRSKSGEVKKSAESKFFTDKDGNLTREYDYYERGENAEADKAYAFADKLGISDFFVVKNTKYAAADDGFAVYSPRKGYIVLNLDAALEQVKKHGNGLTVESIIKHENFHRRLDSFLKRIGFSGIEKRSAAKATLCSALYDEVFSFDKVLGETLLSEYSKTFGYDKRALLAANYLVKHGFLKETDVQAYVRGACAEEILGDLIGKDNSGMKLSSANLQKAFSSLTKAVGSDSAIELDDMYKKSSEINEAAHNAEADNAKEYAYQKKLEAEQNSEEAKEQAQSDEDKAKSTFGKDYDKVQSSAEDFGKVKTFADEDAFQQSDKKRDRAIKNKLKSLREAFSNAAKTGDVESLFKEYEKLNGDPDLGNFYNEQVQEEIDNWRNLVDEKGDAYNEPASTYAAARTMQMMAHKFKLANEYQQTLKKMNETLSGSKSGMLRKIAKSDKLTSNIARAMVRWQINPDTVFKMIDAFDKGNMGEGYKLAKELQTAHRKKYEVLRQARTRFNSIQTQENKKAYEAFALGKETVKDYSGREWDMRSALSVIKAIDTIRSTSGKKLGGTDGFGVMDSKGNIEYIKMSDVDALKLYESLKSGLSDVAIKYGVAAVEAFNDVKEPLRKQYKDNNGVDIRMIGDEEQNLSDKAKKRIEKAVYSPLSYVTKDGQVYQFDIAKQDTYNNVPRFLRERSENGGTYLLIKPYTDVVDGYFEQVSNYLAYSSYGEKMRGLAKGSSYTPGLAQSLADTFGKDMGNWYQNYVEDLKTYKNEDDTEGVNSLLRQGRQQLQQGALLFSVSVPMKQISSYWAASGILHPDSLLHAYHPKFLKAANKSDAAAMLASRAMGNIEQSASEAAKDAEKWLGKLKYSSKFIKAAANAINTMDFRTVSNLLTATEYDVLKYQFNNDTSKIGTAEFNAAVEELFQDVVDRSQPNFDKQMRAEYGRTDNEVIRMLSMFRTQQTQNLNLLATAIGEYNAAKGTKNQAKATETLRNTIAGQASAAFSLSALTILADMLLHRQKKYEDDDKELDPTKVLSRLGINALEAASGTLWFGDAIAKWAIDRISGGKTKEFYGVNMGVISTVSDILENFETFMKSPTRSNARYCAGNIATLLGIPLNNAYAMLNSAIMYGKDALGTNDDDYDDILKYLDAQAKAKKKEEAKAAKEAEKAAAKEAAKSGADLLADTAKKNSSESELNSAEEQKTTSVGKYMVKPYTALVEAGMSSQQSQQVLTEMDTDGNNSVKQSEMLAYYKAHPEDEQYVEAMWNSYGYKTTWEAAKKKAG